MGREHGMEKLWTWELSQLGFKVQNNFLNYLSRVQNILLKSHNLSCWLWLSRISGQAKAVVRPWLWPRLGLIGPSLTQPMAWSWAMHITTFNLAKVSMHSKQLLPSRNTNLTVELGFLVILSASWLPGSGKLWKVPWKASEPVPQPSEAANHVLVVVFQILESEI